MSSTNGSDVAKSIVTVVTLLCATVIVVMAINQGLCDEQTVIIVLVLLFGGEQVAKLWIRSHIDNGTTKSVPPLLLTWYHKTEGRRIPNGNLEPS